GRMGSLDTVELNPVLDTRSRTAEMAVDLVESLFRTSTLMRYSVLKRDHADSTCERQKCAPPHAPSGSKSGADMKRIVAMTLLSLLSLSMLTACNTIAGAGQDILKGGEKLEDKAQDCKDGKC